MPATISPVRPPIPYNPYPVTASFSGFSPTKITMYRDGGTIKMHGLLNRSVEGDVRFDGSLSSPTRGKFFVATKFWNGGASPERPMTKPELRQLKTSIERFLRNNPHEASKATYKILEKDIAAALKA
jgi:hypothetical protein